MIDKIAIVPVASFQSSIAGHACANALTSLGVNATVVGDHISDFRVGSPGVVNVLVSSEQLEHAKTLLESMPSELNSSEDGDYGENESSIKGWKKFVVWSIFWINIAGMFSYIGFWLFS